MFLVLNLSHFFAFLTHFPNLFFALGACACCFCLAVLTSLALVPSPGFEPWVSILRYKAFDFVLISSLPALSRDSWTICTFLVFVLDFESARDSLFWILNSLLFWQIPLELCRSRMLVRLNYWFSSPFIINLSTILEIERYQEPWPCHDTQSDLCLPVISEFQEINWSYGFHKLRGFTPIVHIRPCLNFRGFDSVCPQFWIAVFARSIHFWFCLLCDFNNFSRLTYILKWNTWWIAMASTHLGS